MGDISKEEGALVVLEGSHLSPKLTEYSGKDADRDKLGWLSTDPIKLQQSVGGRWLSTDFNAGDVLCFSVYLAHGTFDNNSPIGKCRLSSDTRYQLKGEPLDDRWNGDISNPHGDIISQTLLNIQSILKALNGNMKNIISMTNYTTDIDSFMETSDIRNQYFEPPYPTTTTLEVSRLYDKRIFVEITAIAEIPELDSAYQSLQE